LRSTLYGFCTMLQVWLRISVRRASGLVLTVLSEKWRPCLSERVKFPDYRLRIQVLRTAARSALIPIVALRAE